mmetsp:Transcript_57730/g.187533  ORF Transcript_57730/g.187533 Transcript_57730/m.187533 type:complete len:539 (+) Transcript_57730:235-1851(+)
MITTPSSLLLGANLLGVLLLLLHCLHLQRGDAQLDGHLHKLLEADRAALVRVVLVEECLHGALVHVLIVLAELPRGCLHLLLDRRVRVRARGGARGHAPRQVLHHGRDELLRGLAAGPREVPGAAALAERGVHRLPAVARPPEDVGLVAGIQDRGMLHGAQEGDDHAQGVHRRLLAPLVRVPQVRDGPVGGLELFDEAARFALADQVRCDEAGAAVDLSNLIGQHVSVVVVAGHAEAAASPTDDLHGGGVADQVHEVAAGALQKAGGQVFFLVVFVEDCLHLPPETLLPLENGLLGDNVRHDVRLQATREEDVRQVLDVVQRVVVDHDRRHVVVELPAVDDLGLLLDVVREERRKHAAFADILPTCAVLAAHRVTLEEDRLIEAQLDAWDVDRVARDGDAVPAATHGSVGRATRLLEAKLLNLLGAGRDGGLLEDGAEAGARGHGLVQHLVVGIISMFAAQVEVLPLRGVDEGFHPLLADNLHGVPRHLLAGDVGHRWGRDLVRGEGADPQATWGSPREAAERAQHREGAGWKTNPHG